MALYVIRLSLLFHGDDVRRDFAVDGAAAETRRNRAARGPGRVAALPGRARLDLVSERRPLTVRPRRDVRRRRAAARRDRVDLRGGGESPGRHIAPDRLAI